MVFDGKQLKKDGKSITLKPVQCIP